MTREEERDNASFVYYTNTYASIEFLDEVDQDLHQRDIQEAFEQGAEWADAHPDIDVRTMAAWQSGYKEAIEKACEWLENDFEESTRLHLDDIVIDKFRKAMKGE